MDDFLTFVVQLAMDAKENILKNGRTQLLLII